MVIESKKSCRGEKSQCHTCGIKFYILLNYGYFMKNSITLYLEDADKKQLIIEARNKRLSLSAYIRYLMLNKNSGVALQSTKSEIAIPQTQNDIPI